MMGVSYPLQRKEFYYLSEYIQSMIFLLSAAFNAGCAGISTSPQTPWPPRYLFVK
jgi:hypothetical protein